jgi:molybdate transport system regulatory protein
MVPPLMPSTKNKPGRVKKLQPRIRILSGKDIAIGPGKADLLESVHKFGSISEGAAALGMSYMRAWTLIRTMQTCFKEPLVNLSRGGAGHGGASLTRTGLAALKLYRRMEQASLRSTRTDWRTLLKLMR